MLIVPRLTEAVLATLDADPLLTDLAIVPGGRWRDLLPQEQRYYPALVVTYVVDTANLDAPQFTDVSLEVRGEIDGYDLDALRDPLDRADELLRTITRRPPSFGAWDGIKFSNARRVQHVQRTTTEAGGGVLFGHLGGVYQFTCSEPPVPPPA